MNFGTQRPLVTQELLSFPLVVSGTAGQPTPISTSLGKTRMITTFSISNPTAGSSVYLGGANVTTPAGANTGFEIQAGTAPVFKILQETRQLYELQALLSTIAQGLKCQPVDLEKIPFVVWDLTQLFLISANAGGSNVTISAFPQMYL